MYVGDLALHFNEDLKAIIGFGIDRYRTPPIRRCICNSIANGQSACPTLAPSTTTAAYMART